MERNPNGLRDRIRELRDAKTANFLAIGAVLAEIKETRAWITMKPSFSSWGAYVARERIGRKYAADAIKAANLVNGIRRKGHKKVADLVSKMSPTALSSLAVLEPDIAIDLVAKGAAAWPAKTVREEVRKALGLPPVPENRALWLSRPEAFALAAAFKPVGPAKDALASVKAKLADICESF